MDTQQNFFKLLRYSNELKQNNKYLGNENQKAFDILLKFRATLEDNFHYLERVEYIELAKQFLVDQMSAEDFSYSFIAIHDGINRKLCQLEK